MTSAPIRSALALYILAAALIAGGAWSWLTRIDIAIPARGVVRPAGDTVRVMAEAGGAIGVVTGVGIATLVARLVPALESAVPVWAIVLGLGFCSLVGLFFGIYPAVQAARLDPILALRDD